MSANKLTLQFFNFLPELKTFETCKNKIIKIIDLLPEYSETVNFLGIFFAHKLDSNAKIQASKYTNTPDALPINNNPYAYLMMEVVYQKTQAIVVFYEDFIKANDINFQRTLLHEMTHAICGHQEGRRFQVPKFFSLLPKDAAQYIIYYLIDSHRDYEVDCYLAKKFPELVLEYNYSYSNSISPQDVKQMLKHTVPLKYRLEITVYLTEYYRNLFVLEHLPNSLHNNKKFRKAKENFERQIRTCRIWLEKELQKPSPLPPILMTECDFTDSYSLMLWFCKTIDLGTKQPLFTP